MQCVWLEFHTRKTRGLTSAVVCRCWQLEFRGFISPPVWPPSAMLIVASSLILRDLQVFTVQNNLASCFLFVWLVFFTFSRVLKVQLLLIYEWGLRINCNYHVRDNVQNIQLDFHLMNRFTGLSKCASHFFQVFLGLSTLLISLAPPLGKNCKRKANVQIVNVIYE